MGEKYPISYDNMVKTVVRHTGWHPEIIKGLYFDYSPDGLLFYFLDALDYDQELRKRGNSKR